MAAPSSCESERLGLCPHCGGPVRTRTDKKVKRGFDWNDRRAPIEEFETEVRCKRRCQRKAEQETRSRIFPASVGSYLPEASWAEKFRAAGFRVIES